MNHQSSFSLRSFFQPVDLTQGTCWKTLLVFAFPIIVSYLLQQVYSISDAAIVGQTLTASEVAGVNDTTSLAMIFLQFAFGASAGFCTVTSCFVGARDSAGVRRSMATQIVLSAALTAVLTALALALLDPMLAWINVTPASGEVYRAAYTYCAILFGGIGAQLFYNFICSFLRSMGDSATPLAFLLFSTILNVGLDLLFILSYADGEEQADYLLRALQGLARDHRRESSAARAVAAGLPAVPAQGMTPREAFFAPKGSVPFDEAEGRIAAEQVIFYPPGIPILCPGDIIDAVSLHYIRAMQSLGLKVVGPRDASLTELQVVGRGEQ